MGISRTTPSYAYRNIAKMYVYGNNRKGAETGYSTIATPYFNQHLCMYKYDHIQFIFKHIYIYLKKTEFLSL